MIQQFFVPGPLPGLNEIIAAAKGFRGKGFAYAKMKKEWGQVVVEAITKAKLKPLESAYVLCEWREKHKRRDLDNVRCGVKFILDRLVEAGILLGDDQGNVWSIEDSIQVDKYSPGVLVELRGQLREV